MNKERLRIGQQRALDTVLERVRNRDKKTAVVLPTRYGKSDVIRLAAILSQQNGFAAGNIALSPSTFLCQQLVRRDKVDEMAYRYGLGIQTGRMRVMGRLSEWEPFANGEALLSATMQLATRNIDIFADLVKSTVAASRLPVVVHIDECHETSENKRRGELVAAAIEAGAIVILYTATAVRADGEMIPGFTSRVLDRDDVRRYVVTDAGDGKHNKIDVYEGERQVLELVAHHTTSFREAWNEKPSPLCNLSREVIDVGLNDIVPDEESLVLSGCSPSKARRYLNAAVRNPRVIEKAIDLFVRELETRRRVNPDAAGIIYSCSDFEGQSNQHAKEIAQAIADVQPDYDCAIITMKSVDDEKAAKQIERFVGANNKKPIGDVIIVKQMGGAGLDAGRIKVVLDLSPVRTVASVIQRIMRVATPWEGMRTGSVITLADPLMDAIWRKHITEEGGEALVSTADVDMELVQSYLKLKGDWLDPPKMEVVSADIASFDDNNGLEGDISNWRLVNDLLGRMPELSGLLTKAEISRRLAGFLNQQPDGVAPTANKALDDIIAKYRGQIVQRIGDRAKADVPYNPRNPDPHVERLKYWTNAAKDHSGIPRDIELKDVINVTSLEVMLNFLA